MVISTESPTGKVSGPWYLVKARAFKAAEAMLADVGRS